jgi:hypothetical protein
MVKITIIFLLPSSDLLAHKMNDAYYIHLFHLVKLCCSQLGYYTSKISYMFHYQQFYYIQYAIKYYPGRNLIMLNKHFFH